MPKLPKILLLGDSIRMSYQPHVKAMLEGRAEVVGPADNCRFALYTAMKVYDWVTELGMPDIVHWNNGLWDCAYFPGRGPWQFSISDYVINLRNILTSLRGEHIKQLKWAGRQQGTNDLDAGKGIRHVSFATCTPIDGVKRPFKEHEIAWKVEEIPKYNAGAVALMNEQNVPVNDLYSLMLPHLSEWTVADGAHLTEDGQKALAAAVVSHLEPVLKRIASEDNS
jgi:hypothetical protein